MKHFYLLLFTIVPFLAFSQSNYHKGYVVKNSGDTTRGFIDYREWAKTPKYVDFKNDPGDRKPQRFTTADISCFQVDDMEHYIRYSGVISMDRTRFPDLPQGLDTSKKQDTIFLRQLVSGSKLTLYGHADEVKSRYFVAETDQQPIELVYSQYYNGGNTVNILDRYRQQLAYLAEHYKPTERELISKISEARYTESDLTAIVNNINDAAAISVRDKNTGVKMFGGVAISQAKTNLSDDGHDLALITRDFFGTKILNPKREHVSRTSTYISPKLSFGVDIFNNVNVQRLIFRAELSVSTVNSRFNFPTFERTIDPDTNVTSNVTIKQLLTTITPQVIVNLYNTAAFKVYIDGGVGLTYAAYLENKAETSGRIQQDPYGASSIMISFPVQAGVMVNQRLEFFFNYAPTTPFASSSYYSLHMQSIGAGVKYRFSR